MAREPRKDSVIYSPRSALAAGLRIDEYIDSVRQLLRDVDSLPFCEEVALSVLHDLRYNGEAALAALKLCVTWQQPPAVATDATDSPSCAAAANSVLWLQRLRERARRTKWSDGEVEALDAGITAHGKELATLHQHVLREKSLPQLIEMYYVTGWRHQSP